jgi:hypothetical protein
LFHPVPCTCVLAIVERAASSGIWRLQVNDLRERLAQTADDEAEGRDDGGTEHTALCNMSVDEDDPEKATAAAHAWAVTAINAAGDGTRQWATFAHPEERERVPA